MPQSAADNCRNALPAFAKRWEEQKPEESDQSVHGQAQKNDYKHAGKYLVEHVIVFQAQQVVAESCLRADPFADNCAADAVGSGNLQTGEQRRNRGRKLDQPVDLEAFRAAGTYQIFISLVQSSHSVGEADCNREKAHQYDGKDLRSHTESHVNNQDGSEYKHWNGLRHNQKRVDAALHKWKAIHQDACKRKTQCQVLLQFSVIE